MTTQTLKIPIITERGTIMAIKKMRILRGPVPQGRTLRMVELGI